jgi:hypothetical protein
VTGFHAPEGEHRRHLAELESGLRDRLRALDEPVARADWQEVVRQARSPVRPLLAFAVITAVALALIAAAVFGFRSSPATHDALSQGSGAGGTLVSPTQQGGICYEWAGGTRSCASKAAPLGVAWGRDQVAGAVSLAGVSSVRIEFTDGTFVEPDISRISTSGNAGIFLYDIPAGKTVAQVNGYDAGALSSRVLWYSV